MSSFPLLVAELRCGLIVKVGTPPVRDGYEVGTLNDRLSMVIDVVDSNTVGSGPGVTKGRVGTIGQDVFQGTHY